MWLATIDAGRVGESVRPLLVAYQKEAAQVLRDHFFGARTTYLIPRTYAAALAEAARLEEERARLEAENEEMRPNAALGEAVSNANGHIKIELFAKAVLLDNRYMGRNRMFAYLRKKRILMDGGDSHNLPFQRYIDLGWFIVLEGTRTTGEHNFVTFTTRITSRGQLAIVNMMKRDPVFRAVSVEFKGTETRAALPPARVQLHLPLPGHENPKSRN
jgi:phage antirepressor YoqD-like protein